MEAGDRRRALLTVPEVLNEAQIIKAFFYKLLKAGEGPTLTKLDDRTLVSSENFKAWLKTREEVRAA
jgi:predicted DNA-binding transcriptional regulator AlpA